MITESKIVERDASTYAIISARPVTDIFALVRYWDEPQKLAIEYKDGSRRVYVCSRRDAVLGVALDTARNAGNVNVDLTAQESVSA